MPSTRTGASGCSSTVSACAVNASWTVDQDNPDSCAATDTGTPNSPTRCAPWSRSRAVNRARDGICGNDSVNVARPQSSLPHFHRSLSHTSTTGSAARRTSAGRVTTRSCTRRADTPQLGHTAEPGSSVLTQTVSRPSCSTSTSTTRIPSTPNSVEALSCRTVPVAFCRS